MSVFALNNELIFPDVKLAEKDGLLAIGGDLSSERLLLAYNSGIFPWFSEEEPILWWSPNPRFVLFPDKLKISKSMKSLLNQNRFKVTYNQEFEKVVDNCANIKRKGQLDTWITNDMKSSYIELYQTGIAKSVEVWKNDKLVGGLYGIQLGKVFCGESMFSIESNASKFGFIHFTQDFVNKGGKLIDCQVYTKHLASLGAEEIDRKIFIEKLNEYK